jgi:hypothetical protein
VLVFSHAPPPPPQPQHPTPPKPCLTTQLTAGPDAVAVAVAVQPVVLWVDAMVARGAAAFAFAAGPEGQARPEAHVANQRDEFLRLLDEALSF